MKLREEIKKVFLGHIEESKVDDLIDSIKKWALEMVGKDKELSNPYINARIADKGDYEINGYNKSKHEIREKIEESI